MAPDGWVRLPPWDSPLGGDISFVIKTIFPKGVLIDHRSTDETHFFQVRNILFEVLTVFYFIDTETLM